MSLEVIGLLAYAGLLHSLGNLLARRGEDTQAFLWLAPAFSASCSRHEMK